jgi:hypothetical protein
MLEVSYKSGEQLIPHLPRLLHKLAGSLDADWDILRARAFQLEQLPYALGSTCLSFFEFIHLQNGLVTTVLQQVADRNVIQVLSTDHRNLMSFKIDSFLDAARRTQNALLPYISRACSIGLPSSMHDAMKRLAAHKVSLPDRIVKLLSEYWENSGRLLKAYRDLAQHHALVASDARTFFAADGTPSIYLVLPNNPEAKSPPQLKYEEPVVHAFLYLRRAFYELVKICYRVTRDLLGTDERTTGIQQVVFKAPMRLGGPARQEGHRLPVPEGMRRELSRLLRNLLEGAYDQAEESGDPSSAG